MATIVHSKMARLYAGPRSQYGSFGPSLSQTYVTAELSTPSVTLAADSSGAVLSYVAARTTVTIQVAGVPDTLNWVFSKADGVGVTSVLAGATVSVIGLSGDTGVVTITATKAGFDSVVRQFTVTKVRQGAPGEGGAPGENGPPGQGAIKSVAFTRSVLGTVATPSGGSFSSPNPTTAGWSDGVPEGVAPLWQSTRLFTSDGLAPQQSTWSPPKKVANTSSVTYQFSTDNATWSDTASVNSLYMRTGTSSDGGTTWTYTGGVLIKGEKGDKGADGGNAKTAFITATSQVFQVTASGVASPTSVTFSAAGQNVTGSPAFSVTSGTATLTGTGNSRTLNYSDLTTDTATITLTWDGQTDHITVAKVRDGANGSEGLSGLTVIVSNEAHTLPASDTGVVSSYANSGTTIQVFEGATALTAVSSISANGQFSVGTPTQLPTSTLTIGDRSYSSTTATVVAHSGMVSGTDSVVITYPISIRRLDGTSVTFNKAQTLTKSKAGIQGLQGLQGPKGDTGNPGDVSGLLSKTAANILTGTITPQDTGGIKVGSITWNSTTGALTGGSGVAITESGLIGAKAGVATFTLSASTGDATFKGDVITAGDGRFEGENPVGTTTYFDGQIRNVDYSAYGLASAKSPLSGNVRAAIFGQCGNASSGYNIGVLGVSLTDTTGVGVFGHGEYQGGRFTCGITSSDTEGQALYAGHVNPAARALVTRGTSYLEGAVTIASGGLSVTGSITATGNITAYSSSDRRLKENIEPIDNALERVLSLTGARFQWRDDFLEKNEGFRKDDVGVIAQEVRAMLPEVVAERADGTLAVRYEKLVPLLIEAIKELSAKVDCLEART